MKVEIKKKRPEDTDEARCPGLDDFTFGDLEQMLNDIKVHNDKLNQEDDSLDKI